MTNEIAQPSADNLVCPEVGLGADDSSGNGELSTQIESPEVMLNSFLSASSSRLDPC